MRDIKLWVGIAAGLVIAAWWPNQQAAWAQSARSATCVTFAGISMGGSGERALEKDKPIVAAGWQSIGPVAETWVNQQLAAGKTQFFASTVAVNGSVVCAF